MIVQILGIAGRLRRNSYNRALLRQDDPAAVPPFCEDDEHDPAAPVLALRARPTGRMPRRPERARY